ncbi:PREDICTED: acylglycerol kinase, mitochondrial [Dufourea novaeangliae]|uniref:Acylglycerol kinase, mitochondrial n=1 Tax=Dufourea novaeangliae TaxID=178035 RepID=A0A154PD31_DUFNO|nr:PREDICTED: acylglycerol kinase, mitochondrial [Dufourea novaeangliae]KZC09762.1 Acylglycerol kinase, mitochondrial [Dufourea novaeangliae]
MAKVLKCFRTIRNNWKKSVLGVAALSYGVSYSKDAYNTNELMKKYCETASRFGDAPCPTNIKNRHVTIILNPNAKKGKAKKLFTNYCEPLLHLAGIAVTVIQTESENEARKIVMNLNKPTDAIVVAGGDGTLSDVLTGLVRRYNSNINSVKQCPIGILPLGQTNKVAKSMCNEYNNLSDVRQVVEATMAIINEKFRMMDMIEVEPIEENPEDPVKPIYAMGVVEWGAWKDAHSIAKKYWYWGPLRKYATYVLNGYKEKLNWNCDALIKYTNPCDGCSRCYQRDTSLDEFANINKRWWHAFVPRKSVPVPEIDYSKIVNEQCGIPHELPISTSELHIESPNVEKSQASSSPAALKLKMGPKHVGYFSFVVEGWKQENDNKLLYKQVLEAKDIEITPQEITKENTLYIDDEEYELKSVKIKLLSRAVKVFCPDLNS